ncbi:TetR/AcrR family transcriptional regulator [Ruegeria sp. EL01]|jgi:AcrR family transcriptional regulator|uniref:TetR/AcrR family transcriptional regulator n=1 Tax=Ruegeria sp. EL01 TaxID=2107578 RepID=UPI000EA81517|nr:TetR/AcrR family transcriptional regulator [Ruegeria sp. EL01]
MGLRERKKAATTQRILAEASTMFQEKGYENIRIEDIAANSDLSVATFYNYFKSKADILLNSVASESETVLANAEEIIERPYESAIQAFDSLVRSYFTTSFSKVPRSLWRIAVSQTMLSPNSEFCLLYVDVDDRLSKQCSRLLRNMQKVGHIRQDIDPITLGELLFNNINMNFIGYIRSETLSAEDMCDVVNRQSAPLFEAISN